MKKLLFILGFVVLVGTNIFVLSGVVYNRAKGPVTLTELTERELKMPYSTNDENSGLSLRLKWRTLGSDNRFSFYRYQKGLTWFNEEKLKELEFNLENTNKFNRNSKWYKELLPKNAFIVLEYDVKLYKEAIKRTKEKLEKTAKELETGVEDDSNNFEWAETQLKDELESESRLFAIDAGLDANKLLEKYSDQNHFIIVPGEVKMSYNYRAITNKFSGYISRINVESIHVPLKFRKTFDSVLEKKKAKIPRYKIGLAYGKRFEPWIQSVQAFEKK